jgi:hypothetical protein
MRSPTMTLDTRRNVYTRTRLAREHRRDTASAGKSNDILCQNCVRCALKPRSNTVICGDTLMHTVVAESR